MAEEEEVLGPPRRTYQGPLELGKDLMTIEVGEQLTVKRPARSSP